MLEIAAYRDAATRVIEADGAAVLPGLIDAHIHLGSGISLMRGVNLYGIPTKGEWLQRVAARAAVEHYAQDA